jgi:hypothetical protein
MARRKKSRAGAPTKYDPVPCCRVALHAAMAGFSDAKIAQILGVAKSRITAWKKDHREFRNSLEKGRSGSIMAVAKALFSRACGYKHRAIKIFYDSKMGTPVEVPYTERYPPDTPAIIYYLKNRAGDEWKDKTEQDINQPEIPPLEIRILSPEESKPPTDPRPSEDL